MRFNISIDCWYFIASYAAIGIFQGTRTTSYLLMTCLLVSTMDYIGSQRAHTCAESILKTRFQDVQNVNSEDPYNVVLRTHYELVPKTSTFSVLWTSSELTFWTSWKRCLGDVLGTRCLPAGYKRVIVVMEKRFRLLFRPIADLQNDRKCNYRVLKMIDRLITGVPFPAIVFFNHFLCGDRNITWDSDNILSVDDLPPRVARTSTTMDYVG